MRTDRFQTAQARMIVLGLVFILGAFAILAPAWAAADGPVTVTVDGQWTHATGAEGGEPTCVVYPTAGNEQQVRYGDDTWPSDGVCPGDPEVQSGMGFTGAGEIPFQIETPFALGQFCHYNRSIWADNPLTSADLAITLGLGDSAVTLYYAIALKETDNVQCLPEGSACSDIADIVTATPDQTFVIGDTEYTLQIIGFGDPNDPSSITDRISTDENAVSCTALVGQFVVIGPAAAAAPAPPVPGLPTLVVIGLGLAALGGVLWSRRRGAILPGA